MLRRPIETTRETGNLAPTTVLASFRLASLILHNLPFRDRRRLVLPEINLVLQSIGRVEDCFDDGVNDFAAVHADANVIADFGLFTGHAPRISRHPVWSGFKEFSCNEGELREPPQATIRLDCSISLRIGKAVVLCHLDCHKV